MIVQNSRMKGQWHVVPVELLARRIHIEVLSAAPLRVPADCVASLRDFDASGYGILSILDLHRPEQPARVAIFDKKRFAAASPFVVVKRASPSSTQG